MPGVAGGKDPIFYLSPRAILPPAEAPSNRLIMKWSKTTRCALSLIALGLLTGCPGGSSSNNNNNDNNSGGQAPSSLAGHTISVTVNSGASPFVSSGTYVFTPAGDGTSGSYHLQGTSGGVQSNNGTYTYTVTGPNTATLVETEEINYTQVNNQLTFQTSNSGTIASTSPNKGGYQNGTFTLN